MDTPTTPDSERVSPERNPMLRQLGRFNGVVRFVLRSPLHRILSRRLMLLTYTGPKTGKEYTLPLRYLRLADGRLLVMSRGTGWSRRVADQPVIVRLTGEDHTTVARTLDHREEIAGVLAKYIHHAGPKAGSRLYLGLPADRSPTADELRAAADKTRLVLLKVPSPS